MLGENENKNWHDAVDAEMKTWEPKKIELKDPSAFDVTEVRAIEIHGLASMIGGSMAIKLAKTPEGFDDLKDFMQTKARKYLYDNAENLVREYLANKFPNQENEFGDAIEAEWNK